MHSFVITANVAALNNETETHLAIYHFFFVSAETFKQTPDSNNYNNITKRQQYERQQQRQQQ